MRSRPGAYGVWVPPLPPVLVPLRSVVRSCQARSRWAKVGSPAGEIDALKPPFNLSGFEPRMDADHVGSAIAYMASLPLDANVLFMTVMATKMPFVGRG